MNHPHTETNAVEADVPKEATYNSREIARGTNRAIHAASVAVCTREAKIDRSDKTETSIDPKEGTDHSRKTTADPNAECKAASDAEHNDNDTVTEAERSDEFADLLRAARISYKKEKLKLAAEKLSYERKQSELAYKAKLLREYKKLSAEGINDVDILSIIPEIKPLIEGRKMRDSEGGS